MKKNVTLVTFPDLLEFAETIKYTWNGAHKILVDDEVPPMYESTSREYCMDEMTNNDYGWSDDSVKIVVGFMKKNKIEEMTLIK